MVPTWVTATLLGRVIETTPSAATVTDWAFVGTVMAGDSGCPLELTTFPLLLIWKLPSRVYEIDPSGIEIWKNPEPLIAIGYFLCGIAVIMTIGILIMAIKLKKINDLNAKNKKNLNL